MAMRVMSIIGIVWFSLSLFCMFAFMDVDVDASLGWGLLGLLYALPYSITGLVLSLKTTNTNSSSSMNDLLKLNELKENGILSEKEFQEHKAKLIK